MATPPYGHDSVSLRENEAKVWLASLYS